MKGARESSYTEKPVKRRRLWLGLAAFCAVVSALTLHSPFAIFTLVLLGLFLTIWLSGRRHVIYGVEAAQEAFPEAYISRCERLIALYNYCVRRKIIKANSPLIAVQVLNLSRRLVEQSNFKRAESVLRQCIDCFGNATTASQVAALAALLESQATVLRLLERGSEAKQTAHLAQQLKAVSLPEEPAYRACVDLEEKDQLLMLESIETNFRPADPDLALFLHSLANWYTTVDSYEEKIALSYRRKAKSHFQRSLSILDRHDNIAVEDLVFLLHDYAYYCLQRRDFNKAKSLCQRLLPLLEVRLGKQHAFVAVVLMNCAVALRHTGNPQLAQESNRRATQIWSVVGDRVNWEAHEQLSEDWALF